MLSGLLTQPWRVSWSYLWGQGWGGSRVWAERSLRWLDDTFDGFACREHAQYPAFAPRSWWQLGFWCLCSLWSIIYPDCTCMQFFSVPYSFFVFYCSRRHLPGVSTAAKGPRSQVPGPSQSQSCVEE